MKTRIVVHLALNSKGERVGCLVCVAGRLIPFDGWTFTEYVKEWGQRSISEWIAQGYSVELPLEAWKMRSKEYKKVVRFQRVTLLGETK